MMTPAQIKEFEALVQNRLLMLDEEDEASRNSRDIVTLDQQSVGRLSRMDALQQQAMANATHQRRAQKRMALKGALARIADGEFGECLDCGDDIPIERLKLEPAIARCLNCIRG